MTLLQLFRRPRFSGHSHLVAWRNADVYFLAWKTDFLPPLLEPILWLLAIGYGLGTFIEDVQGMPYAEFLAPALLTLTALNASFFECSYGSFVRMYWQKTYDAIIATPVGLDDVILGELLWAAIKSVINAAIVLGVITAFGLVHSWLILLALPVVFVAAFAFGAIGILTTSQAPNIDAFNYPMYLYVTPMWFLSGTFFPLTDALPPAFHFLAYTFPLTHATRIARGLNQGLITDDMLNSFLWLLVVGLVLTVLSINAMRQRLIK
ncbi:MAG TPA: ABC transporter permease [Candidatus Thermoplasmatota archaeon]|nr:ABC transporter permease [Candidatus Thermoplasmatota archaeon]